MRVTVYLGDASKCGHDRRKKRFAENRNPYASASSTRTLAFAHAEPSPPPPSAPRRRHTSAPSPPRQHLSPLAAPVAAVAPQPAGRPRLRGRTSARSPPPDVLLAAASSDGSLASFSLSSSISSSASAHAAPQLAAAALVDPVCIVQAHSGPVYDAKFYNHPIQPLLFSCGDDGHIRGWRWHEMQSCLLPLSLQGDHVEPILDLVNPQHEGPWGAWSPIPENNAIAISKQDGSLFAAAGDACAYCWDVVCIFLRKVASVK